MLDTLLEGARTHNLREVSLTLRPGQVVVVTGVSGAGKSSLSLDTLYAEGQRRFVESFSPYARQFLERLERPPVARLDPVPAGVAVDRRAPIKSSRSTVATLADVEPYLAALFVREAHPLCPVHDCEATALDPSSAAERVGERFGAARVLVTFPVEARHVDRYLEVRDSLVESGLRRLWLSGRLTDIDQVRPSAAVGAEGPALVVLDRVRADDGKRVVQGVESAWQHHGSLCVVRAADQAGEELTLRQGLSCPVCGRTLPGPRPGLFSYESPLGACATCRGFGRTLGVDLDKVIPDPERALAKGAVRPWRGASTRWERSELSKLCRRHDIPTDRPWARLTERQRRWVLEGDGSWDSGRFPGISGWFKWLESRAYKMHVRVLLSRYRSYDLCHACDGQRLNPTALAYRVGGANIAEWHALEVSEARRRISDLTVASGQGKLARREIETRLEYLEKVGLGYLTLHRQARTLSGGEAQRVALTAALGTSLNNALFVLDEPTVGLHPSDVAPLIEMLRELSQRNNTVLVVEHDPLIIAGADRVLELGPGAGREGGRLVADGTVAQVVARGGATARTFDGSRSQKRTPRSPAAQLFIRGASDNNLRSIDVLVPLGVVAAITGPSGSGKSTLAVDIVYRALARRLGDFDVEPPGAHTGIDGLEAIRKVSLVDATPLGRTSRGNAATYTKAWDAIRALYAAEPEAAAQGFSPATFSFNVDGGRCEACSGEGYETVEMQFLADVRLICPICRGRRFKEGVLAVQHRGVSIADVLEMTVDQALDVFRDQPKVSRALGPLPLLGLGYLGLGQPLSTLSGGEAQRLKLCRSLSDDPKGTLLVLDEPSAGLHADEVGKLSDTLDRIVAAGGSVLVVDHDLDLIARADWVIDLGPGAGVHGGQVVAEGPPARLAKSDSRTGRALRAHQSRKAPSGDAAGSGVMPARSSPRRLVVTRAREHNLRDVSVEIPHQSLCVVTGPSGSGKSTLAFDVVFAEGQRRFLDTLTPYARQFLPSMPRPDVDQVSGVPPSIALEQRTSRAGARSTVATVTEVAHYLRLLYAKLGVVHCPVHQGPISRLSPEAMLEAVSRVRQPALLLAPAVQARKGVYLELFSQAHRDGIERAYCDGEPVLTDSPPRLKKSREHSIDLVMSPPRLPQRFTREELARALRWGRGALKLREGSGREHLFSSGGACPVCGLSIPELDPRWFSFATRQGRCEACEGEGTVAYERVSGRGKNRVVEEWTEPCAKCEGTRLAPVPRAVRLAGERYPDFCARSVSSALSRVKELIFQGDAAKIADPLIRELSRRLSFLGDVGLDYLTLDRAAETLSGGELQRLRLAAQLGAGLTGALYVLDEPTIGLHPRDTARLLSNLRDLVALGSTVVVVEHDADTIRAADHLIDLGPGGGSQGGRVVAQGRPEAVLSRADSPTGRALSAPPELRPALSIASNAPRLELRGATAHNLKDVDLSIPVGRFTAVCGVSGSGKSTLVRQVLLPAVRQKLGLVTDPPKAFKKLTGTERLARAIAVDQSPIGRTPRSTPATFLGIWDVIRRLYAATPDAKVAGFSPARFSFNTPAGGRCTQCDGQGSITHEMSFLPDVITPCPACAGTRFEPQTLAIRFLGLSIGEVLALTAEEAAQVFANHPKVASPLKTLSDLGAGYITLGQGSHTLSGGEAQRLKLAAELTATSRHEPTLYVLDEPTTGLHLSDVTRLVHVLGRLVERGDTLVVIEHHPQVLAGADQLVELGPEGGERGGRVVFQGTVERAARADTATGQVIRELLGSSRKRGQSRKGLEEARPS